MSLLLIIFTVSGFGFAMPCSIVVIAHSRDHILFAGSLRVPFACLFIASILPLGGVKIIHKGPIFSPQIHNRIKETFAKAALMFVFAVFHVPFTQQ